MDSNELSRRIAFAIGALTGDELTGGNRDVSRIYYLLTDPTLGQCCATSSPKPNHECRDRNEFQILLNNVLKNWRGEDQFVFYFTGHGKIANGEYCLQLGPNEGELLPFNNLLNDLRIRNVRRAIIILDTCYSGKAAKSPDAMPILDQLVLPKGTAIIASSRESQISLELPNESISVFTHLFCLGLDTGLENNKTLDGYITVDEIVNFVREKLENDERYSDYHQRPVYRIEGADRSIWISKNRSGIYTHHEGPAQVDKVTSLEDLKFLYERTHPSKHPCFNISTQDLDWSLVEKFAKEFYPELAENFSKKEILSHLKLFSPIAHNDENALHKSAVLCFAHRPDLYYEQAKSVFVVGKPGDEGFVREDITGPLSRQVTELISKVKKYFTIISSIGEDGLRKKKSEIDMDIVRELISNAIAHRDYESNATVKVLLTEDAFEIKSPGIFPPETSWYDLLNSENHDSYPINLAISTYLSNLLAFEGIGRGFSKFKEFITKNGNNSISYEELPGPITSIRVLRSKMLRMIGVAEGKKEVILSLEEEIKAYTEKIEALYEHLPLFGFKTKLRVPIRLEEVYVPLRAMIDLRATGDACFADAADAEEHLRQRGEGREISVPEAFNVADRFNRRGIVILGDPGSGKTTHLKRLLIWSLRGGLADLNLPPDTIPVFLPLRELRDLDHGLDAFIQNQLDHPHLGTTEGFAQRLLHRGNLLLLFDGLDEVADLDQRAKVSRWIQDAMAVHASCRFVVTSRFAGYTPEARLNEVFIEMHMRPMSTEQAEAFIRNWYRSVEVSIMPDADQAKIIAAQRADDLIDRLRQPEFRARRVFEMTRNPLLLTNLCLVHRDRGNLPYGRAQLYEECIDVLLELWRGGIAFKRKVTAKTGRQVLQPAALWMHGEEERTRASAAELAPVMDPVLQSVGWPHGSAAEFLRAVRDESGLLTGWGQDSYGFMHLGFQEYLAAREIWRQHFSGNPDTLRELASEYGKSWWQEVVLLLLSMPDLSMFEPFMREVVQLPAFAEHADFMEMCLDDAAEISINPFLELIDKPPGDDRELWERQFLAIRIVESIDAGALLDVLQKFRNHPYEPIRKLVSARETEAAQDVIHAEPGGYELVHLPAGTFMMGGGREYDIEKPIHEVHVPEFYMGRYPVTNEEYNRFLEAKPGTKEPKHWGDRNLNQSRQPVVGVSWNDAHRYAEWVGLHLPSEAQWEYACRAGTTTEYYTGDSHADLDRAGWYIGNSGGKLHPVGEKEPNAFGLYDMHGNVYDWTEDQWHDNYEGAPIDGSAWVDKEDKDAYRVFRGASGGDGAENCRSASRNGIHPDRRHRFIGFRLALRLGQELNP